MIPPRTEPFPEKPVLDEETRAEMEERLLEERDRTREDLNTALEEESQPPRESSGALSDLPSHPADAASEVAEADADMRVAERSTEHIAVVDDALHRLREQPETYGVCEICGETIAMERLRLLPWTRRCAEHAPEGGEEARSGRGAR